MNLFRYILRRMRPRAVHFAALLSVVALVVALASCSTKKNTPLSRNWQAFTTRYNVYYNGDEHYKEQLKEMELNYEDDYTRTLLTHPAEARANEKLPQPTGDFKRTIEKMQKAIQLHSIKKKPKKKNNTPKEKAFRAREEFNPFLHNAWLMMGRSQFYNGDFPGAAATFFYISRHFKWMPAVVTEARLWQARSYCALDWLYEAENAIHGIKEKDLTTKSLRRLYDITMADLLVRSEKWDQAVGYLQAAAKGSSGSQKNRLYFLLGQAYRQLGKNREAYAAFKKAGSGASTAYRTKFNARIKQSEVYAGTNIKGEVNSLKAMLRYSRNKEFFDQIYYAIGNLYLSRKDTAKAKENYILAVEQSTRNGIDKALANLALGNIYFAECDYVKAQPCYSEAVPQLDEKYPGYDVLKKRSDVLDELATYAGNVQLQDSLLDLSKLSPEEQLKVCERLAEELKKKEKEEADAAARAEYEAQLGAKGNQMNNSNAPNQYQLNTDKSWYFYNNTAKNAGKTEFQRRWGARKNEDDWRRRNKASFAFDDTSDEAANDSIPEGEETELPLDSVAAAAANDPHNPEYYMKQIPSTPEQIQTCNDIIQEGLFNMGLILKDKLEDFPAARIEFTRLDTRYPDNIYRLDVYYNMYLMAVRDNDTAQAERWRQKILADFPDSPYGIAMQDPDYFNKLREMHLRQEELYKEVYDAYLDNRNEKVHRLTAEMEKEFPLSPIMPKFVFIDALSYVTDNEPDKFKERLEYLLDKWPQTDMTDMAGSILKNLKSGRKLQGGGTNVRGMLWDTRLTADTLAAPGADGQPADFERDPSKPQYLVLAFPVDSVSPNQLLYDVARFNFSSFVVKDFDLEQMRFGGIGLLIVKGFANLRELEHYRGVLAASQYKLPDAVRPIMISKANFELLLRQGRSFEDYFRFEEESKAAETEEEVVGPDRTMPSPENPGDESPESDTPPAEAPSESPEGAVATEGGSPEGEATEPVSEPVSEPAPEPAAEESTPPASEESAEPAEESSESAEEPKED